MIKFIENTGDFFASNYFDEDFVKKVHDKSGYSNDDFKELQKRINGLKDKYYRYKQQILEGRLRTKDKIYETHQFHTLLLNALGFDGDHPQYNEPFHFSDDEVLPVRHKLYRGEQLHMLIMEMQPLIKEGEEEPDGLFEQRYNIDEEETQTKEQRYHRSQWKRVFELPEEYHISPAVINKAINALCLVEQHERPQFILLLAGNKHFLIDVEKWFRGSYLQFDLEELFTEGTIERKYYSLFYLILAKEMLAPDSDMVLMNQLEEDSHKSAYEVTKDLKEGIIHAVEALANEALYYKEEILGLDIDESDDTFEQEVKDDCLNIVYRLLFIFYAESRPDLDILPIADSVYQKGYSLEMLRDLEQVNLTTDHAMNGYFFHDSLHQLFSLMSNGYRERENGANKSFRIRHIDSPLFNDAKLIQLGGVKFRNVVWQDVICQLSLSRQVRGKNRGRISYANLGINQLGSVYESLLAYRGFYAEEDYIEVHPKGKPKEGTLLVQRRRRDDFHEDEVLKDEQGKEVVIPKGQFVYRLSGRDRQKSASYYTPEVLTQCTVKYTLKGILEKVENGEMKALELLDLKLLEPAMGAAAFHNELINQLAEAYLNYRQKELKQKISPEHFREELQKVKAYIAINNTYGVDLNPTAIELGKLSLWLNVIHRDMETPFFGYRLGVGNAVVGAWLKVFKKKDIIAEYPSEGTVRQRNTPIAKDWWSLAPKHLKFSDKKIRRKEDEIYHFLLPDKSMVPSAGIKLLKADYPDEAKRVSDWRKEFCKPIEGVEFRRLQKISNAIDVLLEEHYKFQASIIAQTAQKGDFFGAYEDKEQGKFGLRSYDEKEQLAANRNNTNAPYYKLKLIMDYWCSLWFWDVREAAELPDRETWYDDLELILNIQLEDIDEEEKVDVDIQKEALYQGRLFHEPDGEQLTLRSYRKDKSGMLQKLGQAVQKESTSLFSNTRSEIVNQLADKHSFFHYQLEFIEVFAERNGFDLIVGNPPWVKITFEARSIIADFDPLIAIKGIKSAKINLNDAFSDFPKLESVFLHELNTIESVLSFVGGHVNYPELEGQQSDLYKLILVNSIHMLNQIGVAGLIHPPTVFEDSKGGPLRKLLFHHLKFLFQFRNELVLFPIGHTRQFSIAVLENHKQSVDFVSINNLFHPNTIDQAFTNQSSGELSFGLKRFDQPSNKSTWETRGNRDRIVKINNISLDLLRQVERTKSYPKFLSFHLKSDLEILKKIFNRKSLKQVLENYFITEGFHETNQVKKGHLEDLSSKTEAIHDLKEFIFVGPQVHICTPFYRCAQSKISNHHCYDNYNYSNQLPFELPRATFRLTKKGRESLNLDWLKPAKVAFNKMLDPGVDRTVQPCILPPNTGHTGSLISFSSDENSMLSLCAFSSTILFDFFIKVSKKANVSSGLLESLPYLNVNSPCMKIAMRMVYELNTEPNNKLSSNVQLSNPKARLLQQKNYNLSNSMLLRRYAFMDLDVLVALELDLSLNEILSIYTTYFPISTQYENDTWYDQNGMIVFTNNSQGLKGIGVNRPVWETIKDLKAGETYEHTIEKSELYNGKKVTYHAPFDKCDRVEDYKVAWKHFEEVFKNSTD